MLSWSAMPRRPKLPELPKGTPRLDDQLCFGLYAASRAVQQLYRPVLDTLGITYPQYLVLMVLWEEDGQSLSALGDRLLLDSGTLTPLLKRMETAGLVSRARSENDGRVVLVSLTDTGRDLREVAPQVPRQLAECLVVADPDHRVAWADLHDQLRELLQALRRLDSASE